jgi:FKBP-type peptidyl-prolyl cis-trans isomerase (trigger factor)
LSKVTEAENIEVTGDDVDAEIEKMTASAGPQGAQLKQLFSSEDGRGTIRRNLITRKALARLVEIATQDGAAAEPTAEVEQPKKKSRSKKAAKATEEPAAAGGIEEE